MKLVKGNVYSDIEIQSLKSYGRIAWNTASGDSEGRNLWDYFTRHKRVLDHFHYNGPDRFGVEPEFAEAP